MFHDFTRAIKEALREFARAWKHARGMRKQRADSDPLPF